MRPAAIARCFGLAGHQALVDLGGARRYDAVGRHAFARPHQQPVARLERSDRHHHDLAARLEPVRDLGLQGGEIAGDRARLAAHGVIEIAPAQQEEQQHHGRIEIGVLGVVCGLIERHAEREQHAERDRHVHVELPRADRAPARSGRTAGLHRRRPAARSAPTASGRSRASPASCRCPDHTDTDSSMMFMAAKPATARHFISQRACSASSVSARSASNGCAR